MQASSFSENDPNAIANDKFRKCASCKQKLHSFFLLGAKFTPMYSNLFRTVVGETAVNHVELTRWI